MSNSIVVTTDTETLINVTNNNTQVTVTLNNIVPSVVQIFDGTIFGGGSGSGGGSEESSIYLITNYGNAVTGQMTLLQLTSPPTNPEAVLVFFNGLQLQNGIDYIVSSQTIVATPALNESYGGNNSDGLGFADTDVIAANYSY